MSRKKIKILSIDRLNSEGAFMFYYKVLGGKYHRAAIAVDGELDDFEYPQKFRDMEHFVGVIGKFNPYTWFAPEPYNVKDGWGYKEIKEAYDYFNETYWGGTGSPWA